ncbi:HIT domain-containing protein [Candidatus Woesearchaeota archaeon]|nr:HIT domain-containing protein [Candidatus Woesearchaeota archaeon]
MTDPPCPLCRAATESFRLIDDDAYAFATVNRAPMNDLHFLVLPKRHVEQLDGLSAEETRSMAMLLFRLEKAIMKARDGSGGVMIFMGRGAHKSLEHLHFHILPTKGDPRRLISAHDQVPYKEWADERKLIAIKEQIMPFL